MDKDRWGDIYWAEPSGSSWLKFLLMTLLILLAAAAAAKSLQSCLTLCDPIDGSQPGSTVPGILQARTLEWVAISCFNAWKWKVKSESEVAQCDPMDPMDCSLPGSSVHGIFQARVLEWVAIAFSGETLALKQVALALCNWRKSLLTATKTQHSQK